MSQQSYQVCQYKNPSRDGLIIHALKEVGLATCRHDSPPFSLSQLLDVAMHGVLRRSQM
jgi:hypothetical protein